MENYRRKSVLAIAAMATVSMASTGLTGCRHARLANSPATTGSHWGNAREAELDKKFSEADAEYRLALKANPEMFTIREDYGHMLIKWQHYDEAREQFNVILKLPIRHAQIAGKKGLDELAAVQHRATPSQGNSRRR
jgi:tetratricopeptide (TPR) repeat protein